MIHELNGALPIIDVCILFLRQILQSSEFLFGLNIFLLDIKKVMCGIILFSRENGRDLVSNNLVLASDIVNIASNLLLNRFQAFPIIAKTIISNIPQRINPTNPPDLFLLQLFNQIKIISQLILLSLLVLFLLLLLEFGLLF